jgi:hypothetical protein
MKSKSSEAFDYPIICLRSILSWEEFEDTKGANQNP